jgi:hypothetical protein
MNMPILQKDAPKLLQVQKAKMNMKNGNPISNVEVPINNNRSPPDMKWGQDSHQSQPR